ncbi:MAG: AAA family ATPase [Myxococcota bacterium]
MSDEHQDDPQPNKEQWRRAWEQRALEDEVDQAERIIELKRMRAELHLDARAVESELAELEGRGDWTTMVQPLKALRWLHEAPPPRRMLLERDGKCVLPMGKVGFFVGEGGVGKTWALLQMAVAVTTGTTWFQHYRVPEESQGSVFLAMGEEDPEEMHRRIHEIVGHLGLAAHQLSELEQRLWPIPLAGHFVEFLTDGDRSFNHERFEQTLRQSAPDDGWKLVILDPASRFMGIDAEKDNAYATRFVQLLEQLTKLPGNPTVLCAHHTTKAARSSQASGLRGVAARGASALTDGARWQGNLTSATNAEGELLEDMAVFRITKSNYGPMPPALYLQRKPGSGVLLPSLDPDDDAWTLAAAASASSSSSAAGSVFTFDDL